MENEIAKGAMGMNALMKTCFMTGCVLLALNSGMLLSQEPPMNTPVSGYNCRMPVTLNCVGRSYSDGTGYECRFSQGSVPYCQLEQPGSCIWFDPGFVWECRGFPYYNGERDYFNAPCLYYYAQCRN